MAEGALTDEGTVIVWVAFGNPTRNAGRFRECFRRYRHRWITRHIDSRSVEGTNKAYLQSIVDDAGGEDSDVAKYRVRGEFPSQSPMQFIGEADVEAARGAGTSGPSNMASRPRSSASIRPGPASTRWRSCCARG